MKKKEEFTPWEETVHNIYEFQEVYQNFYQKQQKKCSAFPSFRKLSAFNNLKKISMNSPQSRKVNEASILFPCKKWKMKQVDREGINYEGEKKCWNRKKYTNPLPLERISFCKRYREEKMDCVELKRKRWSRNYVLENQKMENIEKYNLYR